MEAFCIRGQLRLLVDSGASKHFPRLIGRKVSVPYQSEISRDHPTCIFFLIDQSGSMEETMPSGRSKAQFVADVLNKSLYTLVVHCTKAEGVRRYFDVGVVSYGGDSARSGLGGTLATKFVASIGELADNPLRVEDRARKVDDGAGGVIEERTKFPVWFDPTAAGGTPMCGGLTLAVEQLADWCDAHPHSYPPTVLHVTDGASTDGDPEQIAVALQRITTNDGPCLLFNLHVSTSPGHEVVFPTSPAQLPDEYAKLLFRMSSMLPVTVAATAKEKGYSVSSESRGMIFNAGAEFIVDFFDIGTRPRLLDPTR